MKGSASNRVQRWLEDFVYEWIVRGLDFKQEKLLHGPLVQMHAF